MSGINNVIKCKWQVNAAFLFQPFDRALLIEDWEQKKKERAQQLKASCHSTAALV